MKWFIWIFIVIALTSLSCREDQNVAVENSNIIDSTYDVLQQTYFWNQNLPPKNSIIQGISDPVELVSTIRAYSPLKEGSTLSIDQWSTAIKRTDWLNALETNASDLGFGLSFRDDNDLRISFVQPNSQAAKIGVTRGAQILSINGISATSRNVISLQAAIETSSVIKFLIRQNNVIKSVDIIVEQYEHKSILKSNIFNFSNLNIGYINFLTFAPGTDEECIEVLNRFTSKNIDYLIIDLRYNSGGILASMEKIASYLIPKMYQFKVMYSTIHNTKYKDYNTNVYFDNLSFDLPLKKILFISTQETGSASEVLIHSLKPYISTSIVGHTTAGKLMGMYVIPVGDYMILPVSYKIINANKEHDNFKGLLPDITSYDDLTQDFTEKESMIARSIQSCVSSDNNSGRVYGYDAKLPSKTPVIFYKPYLFEGALSMKKE